MSTLLILAKSQTPQVVFSKRKKQTNVCKGGEQTWQEKHPHNEREREREILLSLSFMGPLILSLHVRLPLVRVKRVHSSSSSYPVPCSLSRLTRIHNFSCLVHLHENVVLMRMVGFFFRRILLGSQMKPSSCCRHTIVCHCSPWPYQAWEMLRSHSSSIDHASSASSRQEECGGVNAKRRRVGGFGYGFKVWCVVGSCGFLTSIDEHMGSRSLLLNFRLII
jgi:hypothetical protein